jgi:cell division septum initiation protein DivIVA
MGDANTMDDQKMRRELIASATADPAAFVDKVRENFTALTERISQGDARIMELTATAEDQAALITELSLQKDQAKREAEQLLSKARQEAAEIISDAKAQAKQLTSQAETKLLNANVEADSIKTTKLNAIRSDIGTLESHRLTERERTLGFLSKVSQEYEEIIEQCSQTIAKLRTTRAYILDQANEVESMNFEHFDIDQYLPHRSYQPIDQISPVPPMPATTPITTPVQPTPPEQPSFQQLIQQPFVSQPAQPTAQQPVTPQPTQPIVQQPVAPQPAQPIAQQPIAQQPAPEPVAPQEPMQGGYVDDGGIMPTERSFNEMFQRGGQPVGDDNFDDDYNDEPVDEFSDSGLLMEAMAGMDPEEDEFADLAPSDSGLLFDALSSIDDVDDQRDIEEFSEMDDFDEFDEVIPPEPPAKQRIRVPQRRRGNRMNNRGWNQ